MSAYIVVDLTPNDATKLQEYSALAAETLLPFDGAFLVKSPIESLHGEGALKVKVIIAFPDRERASNWYKSDAYQAIIPLRDEAMTSHFHLIG
ncbi:DUF1330 domain-containing protein [Marinomonas sp.]|nr:DUF1330 domain-containing protein [Marinomonas sp.]MDB4837453.1 DUF1330 domain-containing protein [Marinomonas sp.]